MQKHPIQIAYAPWGHNCLADVFVPNDYDPSKKYPLLISLHGQGELGSNLSLLENATGSIPNLAVNGKIINPATASDYEIIFFCPQAPSSQGWSFQEPQVSYLLSQFLNLYSVDQTLIGVTGYSSGGQGTYSCLTDSISFCKLIKFFAPISSAGLTSLEIASLVANQSLSGATVWSVCGTSDSFYPANEGYIETIQSGGAKPSPIFTPIPNGGHWSTGAYLPSFKGGNGLNIYDTFLSLLKPPIPPTNITVPNSTVQKGQSVTVIFDDSNGSAIGSITGIIQ